MSTDRSKDYYNDRQTRKQRAKKRTDQAIQIQGSKLEIIPHHVELTPAQKLAIYRHEQFTMAIEPVLDPIRQRIFALKPEKLQPKAVGVDKPAPTTFDLGF